jgi:hypothetical protein
MHIYACVTRHVIQVLTIEPNHMNESILIVLILSLLKPQLLLLLLLYVEVHLQSSFLIFVIEYGFSYNIRLSSS